MNTDLGRRLHDLAVDAPPSLPAQGLWDRGVRRHRTRRAAGIVGTFVVVAAIIGGFSLQTADDVRGDGAPPVVSSVEAGHLPRTIHEPSAWSKGTNDAGELGALSVLGASERKRPKGLAGMVAYEGMYGVSAVDGTVRFLDLPTSSNPDMPGMVSLSASLSPDGRKVAFPRYDWTAGAINGRTLIGWTVYDAVTGRIVELADPAVPKMNDKVIQPAFSSDSRYLLTAYGPEGRYDNVSDSFVAWDVATGARFVVEAPGRYWEPSVGSGPKGIVWSRADKTYAFDPDTGTTTFIRTVNGAASASYAPSGTGFAYVGGKLDPQGINAPWQLYAGPSPDRLQHVRGLSDVQGILGWRDPDHVVVALTDRHYAVVDVSDRTLVRGAFDGSVNLSTPMLASDLWANDLVDGVQPPHASDPRTPGRLAVLAGFLVAGAVFALYRWRRRHG